jgi:glycine/D-amino acid oxidase-like deaminating enzyme
VNRADVIVIGAGIVGASTAWELAHRGVSVCLVDRGGLSQGTTGLGEGNVLCSDKDVGPELELSRLGRALYDEIEERFGAEARIRRKGALIVHPDARTWAPEPARVERLSEAGVEARLVDGDEARALEPRLTPDLHGATYVPGDLQCDPRAIAVAMGRASGAELRLGVAVEAIVVKDRDDARVAGVRLAGGEILAAVAVVLAAGPWSAPLAATAALPLPVEPRKGQLVRLRLPAPHPSFLRRKIVDASYLLTVTAAGAERQVSTVVETTAGGDVLVGSSRERCGFDAVVDPHLSRRLQEQAANIVPAVAGLPHAAAWVGFRPWLPDHLPAIGPSRRVPGLWLATGHEGAGVAQGPITGRVVAQALTGETPELDLAPFDPDRF